MLRKIVLGTLFIGLIGILVIGAIIRTMDRTEHVAEAQGHGHVWGNGEASGYAAGGSDWGRGYGRGGNRDGYGSQGFVVSPQPNGREDAPAINSTGQANVEEWLTIQGTVMGVDADTLVVQTDSGEHVTMENRTWWFAQEQGFSAQVGDQVTLVGFYENSDFEVGHIDDVTNGQTVLVRDENGRPLWAGRGRRGG